MTNKSKAASLKEMGNSINVSDEVSYEEVIKECMSHYAQICDAMGGIVSLREMMWDMFAAIVAKHVAEYTVPQYGDYPNDQITKASYEDCQKHILRYASRFGTNSRGEEQEILDLLKIANYAGLAYMKKMGFESMFVLPNVDTILKESEKEVEDTADATEPTSSKSK